MFKIATIIFVCVIFGAISFGYDYDPGDFAVEVVEFVQGSGTGSDWLDGSQFDKPSNALGRPTIDTTGDNWNIPTFTSVSVNCVYQAFRSFELVSVGTDGYLTLKFDHDVRDDVNNPYGIDFIVFGNSQKKAGAFWSNGDPYNFMISIQGLIAEGGVVSVSQDGVDWYTYLDGPDADVFAPTQGRVFDPNTPDDALGVDNLWWGEASDPTVPLNPAITPEWMVGKSLAQVSQAYGKSAGGAGFDLAESGMEWIRYVRVEGAGCAPEVDAIADVSACGDYKHPYLVGDINKDCRVDLGDFALLAANWLTCSWDCE